MINIRLKTDADKTIFATDRLIRAHKNAFPHAVRNTLNEVAFKLKSKELISETDRTFTIRRKTFFKANSKVYKADFGDVRKMKATVAFTPKGKNRSSVENLENQEFGGQTPDRGFIPLNNARVSKKYSGNIPARNRLTRMLGRDMNPKKAVDIKKTSASNKGQRYIKAVSWAFKQKGKGALLLGDEMQGGSRPLIRIKNVRRLKGGRSKFTTETLYSYKDNRKAKIEETEFMRAAATRAGRNIQQVYVKNAEIQIAKRLKK